MASWIIFPAAIYLHCKFTVKVEAFPSKPGSAPALPKTATVTQAVPSQTDQMQELRRKIISQKRCVYLPNFTKKETNNICYANTVVQAFYHNEELQRLVRDSLPEIEEAYTSKSGDKPLNLKIKHALVELLDQMENGSAKTIEEAHLALVNSYIRTKYWTDQQYNSCNEAFRKAPPKEHFDPAGRMGDANTLLNYFLEQLGIVEGFLISYLRKTCHSHSTEKTTTLTHNTRGIISFLDIKETGGVQDATQDALSVSEDDFGYTNIYDDGIGGFGQVDDPSSEQKMQLWSTTSKQTPIFNPENNTLILKIRKESTYTMKRADGRFIPEDIITINERTFVLTGVMNHEGNHYTYIKRNMDSWTRVSHIGTRSRSHVDILNSLDEAPGKGTYISALTYVEATEV